MRRKRDPVKVNCEAGDENRQVKIDPGEGGKTESDRKKIKSFHEADYKSIAVKSRLF